MENQQKKDKIEEENNDKIDVKFCYYGTNWKVITIYL